MRLYEIYISVVVAVASESSVLGCYEEKKKLLVISFPYYSDTLMEYCNWNF